MNCPAARKMVDFDRNALANSRELGRHLDRCYECREYADHEHSLAYKLHRAMRAVQIPDGLHDRITARLFLIRRRQNIIWTLRSATAIAAALLLGLAIYSHVAESEEPRALVVDPQPLYGDDPTG